MEQKDIDIYEILKGMPYGTPLYTPMCGNVSFTSVEAYKEKSRVIWTENKNGAYSFDKHGKWMKGGEALLFPSKEMRDWSKFFKKGDVLESDNKLKRCIFEEWANDDYTYFNCFAMDEGWSDYFSKINISTFEYHKADDFITELHIKRVEKKFGGKLNLETLEIEQPKQPAFKIGKLYVFDEEDEDGNVTVIGKLIGKNESKDTLTFGNQYEIETEKFVTDQAFDLRISVHEELREATELEVELFNKHCALWEKKQKEAKEQPVFKPFDKVLVRNEERSKWQPAFFVRDRGEETIFKYKVLSIQSGRVEGFLHCIPFDGNEDIAFTDYDEDLPF